ncbi:MAG: NPCBM/NEW2 domain-containing protein [Acidobacteriota bacterium]
MKRRGDSKYVLTAICLFVLLAAVGVGTASAATFYVSPSGSDTNSGSSSAPLKTIQKAADVVNPGDTVIVANGTYKDTNNDNIIVYLNRGGRSGNWITFRSENKWGAVLDGQNNTTGYCWSFGANASYVSVEDFEVKGCSKKGFQSNAGADYVHIYGNKIHDIGREESTSVYGKAGIFVGSGSTNYTIDSNLIYSNGRLNPNTTPSVSEASCGYNICYGNDHGIYMYGSDQTIINNIFYDQKSGWDIQITGGTSSDGPNWNIVNNTFYGMNPEKDGQIVVWTSGGNMVTNLLIQNNISYGSKHVFVYSLSTGDSTWQLKNNLVYGATTLIKGWRGALTYAASGNIMGQDPLFADLANYDFHLQSTSPAIDQGIYLIGYDADGNPRLGNTDIGAYEYTAGVTGADPASPLPSTNTPTAPTTDTVPPSVPAGLTATAASSSQINLSWTPSTDNVGVAGYKVYRNGTQIATSAANTYSDTGLLSSTSYTYGVAAYDAAGNSSSISSTVSLTTPSTSNIFISALAWVGTPTNGWGPAEKDMCNGEKAAGDGGTITLNGVTYAKGLGVHANSQITYNLGGNYSRFISDIGVDDEEGSLGSVVFQVWADGVKIYDSGLMTGSSATRTVNVDVTGVNQLQLVVTDGGDNTYYDHADWAGAYLTADTTSTPTPTPTPTPTSSSTATSTYMSDLAWVGTPTNGWGPAEKDMSNGEKAAGDGGTITLNGVTYAKGLGVHANSQITYNLGGNYSRFISDIGVDDEEGSLGSVVFQVWADGVEIYDSGLMAGSSATKTVNVDVTGVNQLQLVVTDGGDKNYYDHADWAGAYLTSYN